MINWNEVKVGETVLTDEEGKKRSVLAKDEKTKCLWTYKDGDLSPWTIGFDYTLEEGWAIYDPWVDVSDEVEWKQLLHCDFVWCVYYGGKVIHNRDDRFKFDGRRVWKRKEG